jgi:glycosyltransferase involved in cell wall biosynthesis
MRIAMAHPVYWPEVRRGTERVVHDLGVELAARGHEVTLLTTQPRAAGQAVEDGIRIHRARRPPPVPGLGIYELYLETVPQLVWSLRNGDYDVVHAFYLSSAFGAALARRAGGPRFVYSFHGIPTRRYLVARRRRIWMLETVIERADSVSVLSESAAEPFRRYLRHDPVVLPAGVSPRWFESSAERDQQPTLLCTAAFTDPRKRIPLLLEAFAALRGRRPEVRLLLSDIAAASDRPALPEGARWVDLDRAEDLAAAYAAAWATVLPSVEEAQGMVLLESLASGTPVVAARSGAPAEILDGQEDIGALFAPDDADDLERALGEVLELAERSAIGEDCRARASQFSWSALIERHEAFYEATAV